MNQETGEIGTSYMCMFCSYRATEKPLGRCPGCGSAWPFGKAGVLKLLQIYAGVLFMVFGGVFLYFGATVLNYLFHGDRISWGLLAVLFGLGGILAAGGVSSFFGNSWLLRLMLVFFGVTLRRRRAR